MIGQLRKRLRTRRPSRKLRAGFETLEARLVLTGPTVIGVNPPQNTHTALMETDVAVAYDQDIQPLAVTAETFALHGMQTGQLLAPPGTFSVQNGDTPTLSPAQPFHAGELVQATATTGITNLGGEPATAPFVWQFRAETTGGSGIFTSSGQSLESDGSAVALGDVDGDGDLDALGGGKVWVNDGQGIFADSGQILEGGGVLGDLDGDGDLDAFGDGKVLLNDGQGTFTDNGQVLSGGGVLGDLDGDGDLDAFGHGKVLLNDGQGTLFDSGQLLADGGVLGDLDGDGDLDAFGHGKVLLNDGQGTLLDSGQILEAGNDVALGDVDGDGDLDAVIARGYYYDPQPNVVLLNDGHGNFIDSNQSFGDAATAAVELGDLDGDGDLDIYFGNYSYDDRRVWLNDGLGNFSESDQSLGDDTYAVALGDLDGDGDLDAFADSNVWLNADSAADLSINISDDKLVVVPGQSLTYTISVNNHGPHGVTGATLTAVFSAGLTDVSWTCTASAGSSCAASGTGNINDAVDLLVGSTATYSATATVIAEHGIVENQATVVTPAGVLDYLPDDNVAGDIDQIDVLWQVALNPESNSHTAPVGTDISATLVRDVNPSTLTGATFVVHGLQTGQSLVPPGTLSMSGGDTIRLSANRPLHAGELVQATVTAGLEDQAGAPIAAPFVWRFRAQAKSGSGLFIDSGQRLGGSDFALGDLDGDGDLDAFGDRRVLLNDGHGTFADNGLLLSGGGVLGDLDGDGDLDAFADGKVWLNDGQATLLDSGQILSGGGVLGDLDGDGDLDAFGDGKIWLNDGQAMLLDSGQSLEGSGVLGDLDGDGDLDAVGDGRVWLNDGRGIFVDSGQNLSGGGQLGDLDGDGDLDAFGDGKVWLNDGQGTLLDSGQSLESGGQLGDLDGDGDLDAFGDGRVLFNDGSGTLTGSGQYLADSGAVALGDIDGDGDLDAFVGYQVWLNLGGSAGDFNQDELHDCLDIDALITEIAAGTHSRAFDMTGDSLVDRADRDQWLFEAGLMNLGSGPYLLGDANLDGVVDGQDFLEWNEHKFTSVPAWCSGEFTGDGVVDGRDFLEWNTRKFQTAGTYMVTNLNDSGPGSLRQAVLDSQKVPGFDEIVFPPGLTGTIYLSSGHLDIADSVSITGPGADKLTIAAQGNYRVVRVDDGFSDHFLTVAISGLTITGGHSSGDGGGILSRENLFLSQMIVSDNYARGGGGIAVDGGATTIDRSTIFGNSAGFNGGGIYVRSEVTVDSSTIFGNSADRGGGLFTSVDGHTTATNSTISGNFGNRRASLGGGILNQGVTIIEHATITGNDGGVSGAGGSTQVYSSIIAGNLGSDVISVFNAGFVSNGYNLIGTGNALAAFDNNDQTGVTDPRLGPLADNGGPTWTHALLSGSPALDAGDPDFVPPPDFDQRGAPFARVVSGRVDIGSFESQPSVVDRDFNDDGLYDCQDIDGLVAEIAGGTNGLAFDMTADGVVDAADRDAWLAEAGGINLGPGQVYLLGDATLDGAVGDQDFIRWNENKFTSAAAWCAGDFNADGAVDGQNFILWNENKFQSSDGTAEIVLPRPSNDVRGTDDARRYQVYTDIDVDGSGVTPRVAPLVAKRVDSVFATSRRGKDHKAERTKADLFENFGDDLPTPRPVIVS